MQLHSRIKRPASEILSQNLTYETTNHTGDTHVTAALTSTALHVAPPTPSDLEALLPKELITYFRKQRQRGEHLADCI